MRKLFTHITYFSILYFVVLGTDIAVKLVADGFPYRYISKPLVILLLLYFYLKNHKEISKKNFWLMAAALLCFLIGDIILIQPKSTVIFALGMVFFIGGKLLYAFRFSNQRDFKLSRLLPFLSICFIYTLFLMNLIYDNLDDMFIPVLVYFFASIIVLLFSFLRKPDVNRLSYMLVFVGMIVSMISDSITAIKTFYIPDFALEKITIMLFYGISQYLIVVGIVKEVKQEEESVIKSLRKAS